MTTPVTYENRVDGESAGLAGLSMTKSLLTFPLHNKFSQLFSDTFCRNRDQGYFYADSTTPASWRPSTLLSWKSRIIRGGGRAAGATDTSKP